MHDLEQAFLDFRDRADVDALARVFDVASRELVRVAAHLSTRESSAEDLVQATFLTAIERAPEFERGRRLMPWLVGILANHAARSRRGTSRTPDPADLAERDVVDPAAEVEQRETASMLARAIDALPADNREVVRRHLLEGEPAVDIARRDGLAASTVRMRLLRGLQRLRRRVPASLLGVGAGSLPTPELSAVRERVIAAARARAGLAPVAAASAPFLGAAKAAALLLVLAAAIVAWRASSSRGPADEARAGLSPVASRSGERVSIEPALLDESTRVNRSPAARPDEPPGHGWILRGKITGLDGAEPELARVSVLAWRDRRIERAASHDGAFEIDVSSLLEGAEHLDVLRVAVEHPRNRRGAAVVELGADDLRRGKSELVGWFTDVAVHPFAVVSGRVALSDPRDLERVKLRLTPSRSWNESTLLAGTDRFRIESDSAAERRLEVQCRGCLPLQRSIDLVLGETLDLGTLSLETGAIAIEGTVTPPPGATTADFDVEARRAEDDPPPTGSYRPDEAYAGRLQTAAVDDDGRFRISGLTAGEWTVTLEMRTHGVVVQPRGIRCVAPARGVALGSDVDRLVVVAESFGHGVPHVRIQVGLTDEESSQASVESDAQGRCVLYVQRGVDVALDAFTSPSATRIRRTVPAASRGHDDVLHWELGASAQVATVVLVPRGAPAPKRVGYTVRRANGHVQTGSVEIVDGRYRIGAVPAEPIVLQVSPSGEDWYGGGSYLCDAVLELDPLASSETTVALDLRPGGRVVFDVAADGVSDEHVRARVVDSAAKECVSMFVVSEYEGESTHRSGSTLLRLHAKSELAAALAPGAYRLIVDDRHAFAEPIPFSVSANERCVVRVVVRPR